jgi:hypothetical protein
MGAETLLVNINKKRSKGERGQKETVFKVQKAKFLKKSSNSYLYLHIYTHTHIYVPYVINMYSMK